MDSIDPETPRWRKSSFSAAGNCVEMATLPDGAVAMRNSNDLDAGILVFTRREFADFLSGVKAREFDDLA
jgi:hypothetical protein